MPAGLRATVWATLALTALGVLGALLWVRATATADAADVPGARLSLAACQPSFYDDFRALSVSAWGPNTRWIAHTPWNGDFGDAAFSDPAPDFPFMPGPAGLDIEARKINGKWRSGLLSSTDAHGRGFAQTYGYFEIKTKLPPGPGLWPAFWLDTRQGDQTSIEIDVFEYYGAFPQSYQGAVHVWRSGAEVEGLKHTVDVPVGSLVAGFHTYGVDVEPDQTTFYFDRALVWRTPTPLQHRAPLGILVDLGLGSGFPIEQTPDPSRMQVAYIAAYPPPRSCRS